VKKNCIVSHVIFTWAKGVWKRCCLREFNRQLCSDVLLILLTLFGFTHHLLSHFQFLICRDVLNDTISMTSCFDL